MDLVFLPDIQELPSILDFAADHIRDNPADKALLQKLAQDGPQIAEAVKADPQAAAPLLDIQRRRVELAAKGAAGANGDQAALLELSWPEASGAAGRRRRTGALGS